MLDISIDKTGKTEALIKIKVKEGDYQPGVTQKIKDFSKKANIKGFRPGKVPPGMIKKMYGKSFLIEEINSIVSTNLSKFIKESNELFLGEPLPNEEQAKIIDWDQQQDFEFEYNVGFAENFDLKIDNKIKVERAQIKIDEKVINETIENLQKQFGEVSNPDHVSEGDTVFGPIKSEDERINQEVSIELDQLEKSLIKKFVGLKKNDSITLDLKKAFKDKGYFERISQLKDEELKKVKHKLILTIDGINHTTPITVGQEMFDKTFGKDAVKSEVEFREKVAETIKGNYDKEAEQYLQYKIRETLIEKAKINLPNHFLKSWLLKTNENLTEELLEKEFEHYTKELSWSLITRKVADAQTLKVEHDEVKKEAKNMILQQFGGTGLSEEQLGPQLDQYAENYLQAENGDNYMKVYNQVQNAKVIEFIKGEITIKEKKVSLDEFRKLA